MMGVHKIGRTYRQRFVREFNSARAESVRVAAATSEDVPADGAFFLSTDGRSGFRIGFDGELTNLFSTVRGRGSLLVGAAVGFGADHLDCFDGYLPELYRRHGFVETDRESNWTPGGPDVVYMGRFR